jgi:site-specific recombinase XerD
MPVKEIRRKHLMKVFEKCKEVKLAIRKKLQTAKPGKIIQANWTANTFNQYRSHLSMVYKQMVTVEAVDANLCDGIPKEKHTKKIRETLTPDQRKKVNNYLLAYNYPFWRFLHIFFHSGSRIEEMMQVIKEDVDLPNQKFKITVKKGNSYREEWRTIKTTILPLWEEVYNQAKSNQALFSVGLTPGNVPIRREQVTRRWRRHVKKRFSITADFYSLKHSNSTEVMDLLTDRISILQLAEEATAKMNGHTTTAMVKSIYDTKNGNRKDNLVKNVANTFA